MVFSTGTEQCQHSGGVSSFFLTPLIYNNRLPIRGVEGQGSNWAIHPCALQVGEPDLGVTVNEGSHGGPAGSLHNTPRLREGGEWVPTPSATAGKASCVWRE